MNSSKVETVITENFFATVEYGGGQRGAFARVDDESHFAHGTVVFASTRDLAIAMLIDKAAQKETK